MNMKLTDIVNRIINEDTWGNNPSAAAPMSPGISPTAKTPSPSFSGRNLDIDGLFKTFKTEIDAQEKNSIKKFIDRLTSDFMNKHVKIHASKGGIGQIEKQYDITVTGVDVRYMKDRYYVVFSGKEGNRDEAEYYLDDSVVSIDDTPAPVSSTGKTGGLSQPTSMSAKRNILPQG